jgi:hypothetical protein
MKKVFLFLNVLIFTLSTGCDKEEVAIDDNGIDGLYKNSPSSTIPADLKDGTWFWGNSGPLSYYDHDGNEVGSNTEAGRQYQFSEVNGQGRIQFEQYLGMRNASNCVTEIYTRKKGTVKFEGTDRFTFYPLEGGFKTIKKGTSASCSNETTERKADKEELVPVVFLYQIKVVSGEKLLYVFDEEDVEHANPLFVYQAFE